MNAEALENFLPPHMGAAEQAFLSQIRANPDDDGVRLIYADWLEDHGQSQRAEFIRVQIGLARLAGDDPRRDALMDRQDELIAAHGGEWASAFTDAPWPEHQKFHRGFLEEATVGTQEVARAVVRSSVLRRLTIRKATVKGLEEIIRLPEFVSVRELKAESAELLPADVRRLLRCPNVAGLQSLSLSPGDRVADILEVLGSSSRLGSLTRLGITTSYLGDNGLAVLARSPLLGRLKGLRLGSTQIRPPGLRVLLQSPSIAGLTDLHLYVNCEVRGAVGRALAAATHLRRLNRLCLSCCNLGPEDAAAWAAAKHVGSLRRLDLSYNNFQDEGSRAVALAPQWVGLRELNLSETGIGPEAVALLARAPVYQGLTTLKLSDSSYGGLESRPALGDGGAASLTSSPSLEVLNFCAFTMGPSGAEAIAGLDFPRLSTLNLSSNQMGDEGFQRFLSRVRFPRLSRLSIQVAGLSAASVRSLTDSPLLDRLTELELTYNEIGDQGAAALAASHRTARLRRLEINGCGIGEEGARALAGSPYLKRLQWLNLHQEPIRLPQDGSTADMLVQRFGKRVWF